MNGRKHLLSEINQLHGTQLSFNNLLDLDSGRRLCDEFNVPCCVIIKHNNPCGVAVAETITHAYEKAVSCDPASAFGSVIAVNRPVDESLAQALSTNFVEVLFAPAYVEEALEILTRKPDIRLLVDDERRDTRGGRSRCGVSRAACWCRTVTPRSRGARACGW